MYMLRQARSAPTVLINKHVMFGSIVFTYGKVKPPTGSCFVFCRFVFISFTMSFSRFLTADVVALLGRQVGFSG